MTTRNRLPNRRGADVVSFIHEERHWTLTIGRFADGRLAEVFLDAPKQSPIADAARESALLASLALQHGCPLDTLRHALAGRDVSPIGAALALVEEPETVAKAAKPPADSAALRQYLQQNGEP